MIKKLEELLLRVKDLKRVTLAVAAAEDEEVLQAVFNAREEGIIEPILVGDLENIKTISESLGKSLDGIELIFGESLEDSAKKAVTLVAEKKADFIMKGLLDTSILLKAVLNKEAGLRTDSLLSHVMAYEIPTYDRLLIMTDGGMNIAPSKEEKVKILKNAIEASKAFELDEIKVACLAAKEKPSDKMPATVDGRYLQELSEEGEFGKNVVVEGPLAFDLAVSKEAANIKGFKSKVTGEVDIMLVPTIEVGNGIGKALTYMAGAKSAGVIMGAKVPVVLVSRADDHETKLYSIALGAMIAQKNK